MQNLRSHDNQRVRQGAWQGCLQLLLQLSLLVALLVGAMMIPVVPKVLETLALLGTRILQVSRQTGAEQDADSF